MEALKVVSYALCPHSLGGHNVTHAPFWPNSYHHRHNLAIQILKSPNQSQTQNPTMNLVGTTKHIDHNYLFFHIDILTILLVIIYFDFNPQKRVRNSGHQTTITLQLTHHFISCPLKGSHHWQFKKGLPLRKMRVISMIICLFISSAFPTLSSHLTL